MAEVNKINVLVTYFGKREDWHTETPIVKQVFEVNKLTDLNTLFQNNLIDIKVLR